MSPQLIMIVIMLSFNGRVFNRAVRSFNLTVGPGVIDLREAMLDALFAATQVEHVRQVSRSWSVGVARGQAELDAFVSRNDVDFVRLSGMAEATVNLRKRWFYASV